MTKQLASERIAFQNENGGVPRFVGEIQVFDANKNFGKINHILPDGEVIRIFFHVDEFKRQMIERKKLYLGQKIEYSVRAKRPPSDNSGSKQFVASNAVENLKAVDCIIYYDDPKLTNEEIAALVQSDKENG